MFDYDRLKPIKTSGRLFIFIGAGWAVFAIVEIFIESRGLFYVYSEAIVSFFHIVTGIGIINKKIWGYYLFKSYLYILIIFCPIGTYISFKTFKYIKKYKIKSYFQGVEAEGSGLHS